jgi:hypothetical protein
VENEVLGGVTEMLKSDYCFVEFSEQLQAKEGWGRLKEFLGKLTPREVMSSLGMEELFCLELDIEKVLSSIQDWMYFTAGRQAAYHTALDLVESMLRKGQSTECLDIDSLIPTPGIKLIPLILECRKKEVESARIYFTMAGSRINVRDLKRTYYGRKLMRELQFTKFTRRVSMEDFQRLRNAMSKLGLKIQEPRVKKMR